MLPLVGPVDRPGPEFDTEFSCRREDVLIDRVEAEAERGQLLSPGVVDGIECIGAVCDQYRGVTVRQCMIDHTRIETCDPVHRPIGNEVEDLLGEPDRIGILLEFDVERAPGCDAELS